MQYGESGSTTRRIRPLGASEVQTAELCRPVVGSPPPKGWRADPVAEHLLVDAQEVVGRHRGLRGVRSRVKNASSVCNDVQ